MNYRWKMCIERHIIDNQSGFINTLFEDDGNMPQDQPGYGVLSWVCRGIEYIQLGYEVGRLKHDLIRTYQAQGDAQGILNMLMMDTSIDGQRMRLSYYIKVGNYTAARGILNGLTREADPAFYDVQSINLDRIEAGHYYPPTGEEQQVLFTIAASNDPARFSAQAVLLLMGMDELEWEEELPHFPCQWEVGNGETRQGSRADHVDVDIIPNPTPGIFSIWVEGGGDQEIKSIEVFDLQGRLVGANTVSSPMVDLSDQPPAMYLVRVHLQDDVVVIKRVVKQ